MAYNRVNWEDAPSTATPLNSTNLNNMDAYIAYLDNAVSSQETAITDVSNELELLNVRMDSFINLPDGSTTGDAELADARIGEDGTNYNTAGDAIRAQVAARLKPDVIAEAFDPEDDYAAGDFCIYDHLFYRCITPVTGAVGSSWDSSKWEDVTVSDVLKENAGLEEPLNDIKNLQGRTFLSGTYSGTTVTQVTASIPAGTYFLDIDNVTSTDVDDSICAVIFIYSGSGSLGLTVNRGNNIHRKIVLEHSVTSFYLYASSSYATSSGDTFSFTGFKLIETYPLLLEIDTIEETVNGLAGNTRSWDNGDRTFLDSTLTYQNVSGNIATGSSDLYATYVYSIKGESKFKVTGNTRGTSNCLALGADDNGKVIQIVGPGVPSTTTPYNNYEFTIDDPRVTKVHICLYKSSSDDVKIEIVQNAHELSILFVGNSLTQDGIAYLPYMLKTFYPEVKFRFYMWYNGGYTLAQHYTKFTEDTECEAFSVSENEASWTNSTAKMSAILSKYRFNIVCLQEYFNRKTTYTDSDLTDWNNCRDYIVSHYAGSNGLEFISLFHSPWMTNERAVYDLTKAGNTLILEKTLADDMIATGMALHMARSTDLDELGDQGHLTPDTIHAQEGLPCLLETYTALLWVFERVGINKSIYGLPFKMTASIQSSIHVPGANIGTGVIEGTDAQNLLAQAVAVMAYKAGKDFVDGVANLKEALTDVSATLSTKADKNGTVASAEQLLSDVGTEDKAPYLFRAVPYDSTRVDEEVVGCSVGWNQLVQNGDFADGTSHFQRDYSSGTISASNGELTYTCINADSSPLGGNRYVVSTEKCIPEHIYLHSCDVFIPSSNVKLNKIQTGVRKAITSEVTTLNAWTPSVSISAAIEVTNLFIAADGSEAAVDDVFKLRNVMVIDLTAWFGSTIADYAYTLEQATAGSGVAWIKALLPGGYIPYSAPKMESVSGLSGHRFVGFNAWDEEWEIGGLVWTTGETTAGNDRIRSKNFCGCVPGATYYVKSPNTTTSVFWYDANSGYISYNTVNNATVTAPSNARKFKILNTSITTYRNDTCINISKTTGSPKNGDYVPYDGRTYAIDSDLTLRGILKMDSDHRVYADGDVYGSDGTVTRKYGIVDLGSLTWLKDSNNTFYCTAMPTGISWFAGNVVADVICSKYVTDTNNNVNAKSKDKTIAVVSYIRVWDSTHADDDATTFKAAMSGTILVYRKTTTTETADPFTSPQNCEPGGTEEYVYAEGGSGVPVGHNSRYQKNMRSELERVSDAVPVAPSANGTYTLKATVSGGAVTYGWVSD